MNHCSTHSRCHSRRFFVHWHRGRQKEHRLVELVRSALRFHHFAVRFLECWINIMIKHFINGMEHNRIIELNVLGIACAVGSTFWTAHSGPLPIRRQFVPMCILASLVFCSIPTPYPTNADCPSQAQSIGGTFRTAYRCRHYSSVAVSLLSVFCAGQPPRHCIRQTNPSLTGWPIGIELRLNRD